MKKILNDKYWIPPQKLLRVSRPSENIARKETKGRSPGSFDFEEVFGKKEQNTPD